ncbi:hypothetical protein [Intestinibacter bartlettii]|uniref:ABC-2 family transporter protein n=2 Tax=Intestinibacter bartlettii TaxID=261299 RepID=A0ABS6DZD8_9FIRM|nr:hypothetical protein [Intestinibacter bartlettii]MBU5337215.1 hypothetical protein [Intestinibacter bartlettii]
MKTLIKLDLNKLISNKLLFLLFGLTIFSMDERITQTLSSQQFILYIFTEHYYLTYLMMPIFMLSIYSSLDDDMEYILIRSTSYWNYFKGKLAVYGIFSFMFVIAQFVVAFIMSIGLRSDNNFNVPNNPSYELFGYYSQHFSSVTQATFINCIYMIAGLFIVSIAFFTINNFFSKKVSTKIMIIVYILMIFGLKIDKVNNLPIVFIDNYIIFHRNFGYDLKLFINILTMTTVLIVVCILNKKYWNKKLKIKDIRKNKISYYKRLLFSRYNIVMICSVLILMSFWGLLKGNSSFESMNDYLVNLFVGHPVNNIRIIEFLEMLVLNTTPIYIIAIFLEQESSERSLFINIRFGKGIKWMNSILKTSMLFVVSYVLLNIAIPIAIGIFNNIPITSQVIQLSTNIFIIKVLDLSLQVLVLILLYSLSKNMTLSFLSLLLLNSLCFLPFKWCLYLPFGISSLSRFKYIGDYGLTLIPVIIELSAFILLSFIYIEKFAYKKILID